ncbi:MAG: translation initiation factor IF-6 [Candidatus Micrarchaeia archaeon]
MDYKLIKENVDKNPFLGLFLRASEKHLLAPPRLPKHYVDRLAEALGVAPVRFFVDESPYLGLFVTLNSKGCVLPKMAGGRERSILKEAGLNVVVLSTPHAPGNTILCNDHAALLSPGISKKDVAEITDALGVEVHQQPFAGRPAFAATSVATNKGVYTYNELSEVEVKFLEKIFGVPAMIGTSNFGVPFNSLSIIANSRGAIIGDHTTGYEAQRIYEALA